METCLSQLVYLTCVVFIILLGFGVMFRRVDLVFSLIEHVARQTIDLVFHILRAIFDLILEIAHAIFRR